MMLMQMRLPMKLMVMMLISYDVDDDAVVEEED